MNKSAVYRFYTSLLSPLKYMIAIAGSNRTEKLMIYRWLRIRFKSVKDSDQIKYIDLYGKINSFCRLFIQLQSIIQANLIIFN